MTGIGFVVDDYRDSVSTVVARKSPVIEKDIQKLQNNRCNQKRSAPEARRNVSLLDNEYSINPLYLFLISFDPVCTSREKLLIISYYRSLSRLIDVDFNIRNHQLCFLVAKESAVPEKLMSCENRTEVSSGDCTFLRRVN